LRDHIERSALDWRFLRDCSGNTGAKQTGDGRQHAKPHFHGDFPLVVQVEYWDPPISVWSRIVVQTDD
jgi:hypothetical protein